MENYSNLPSIKTTPIPDISSVENIPNMPVLRSPNTYLEVGLYQTRETLLNVDDYRLFLQNAIKRFRQSRTYKNYKSYLMSLGLTHCGYMGNVTSEMAEIEMHHNVLTIYDIAIIITEHVINTVGYISTFQLVELLKYEHIHNCVQVVMLTVTAHELFHANPDFYIPPEQCFGDWWQFLYRYRRGITKDIAFKIINYLRCCEEGNNEVSEKLLKVRDDIMTWAEMNNCCWGGDYD